MENTEKDELRNIDKNEPGHPFRHTDSEIEWRGAPETMLGLIYGIAPALVAIVASLTGFESSG